MKSTRIPRKATRLAVTLKIDTSCHSAGETVVVEKDETGWHGGGCFWFASLLRTPEFCSLQVLA